MPDVLVSQLRVGRRSEPVVREGQGQPGASPTPRRSTARLPCVAPDDGSHHRHEQQVLRPGDDRHAQRKARPPRPARQQTLHRDDQGTVRPAARRRTPSRTEGERSHDCPHATSVAAGTPAPRRRPSRYRRRPVLRDECHVDAAAASRSGPAPSAMSGDRPRQQVRHRATPARAPARTGCTRPVASRQRVELRVDGDGPTLDHGFGDAVHRAAVIAGDRTFLDHQEADGHQDEQPQRYSAVSLVVLPGSRLSSDPARAPATSVDLNRYPKLTTRPAPPPSAVSAGSRPGER